MSKIIIQLKVIEVNEDDKTQYSKSIPQRIEENSIKLEVDSYEKAEAKVAAYFKMLAL